MKNLALMTGLIRFNADTW